MQGFLTSRMKSLILTVLYLAKDTVNRWTTRVSSPLARILVVFFLSMCSLCFMANYVLSTKMVMDQITQEGGNIINVTAQASSNSASLHAPDNINFLKEYLDCEGLTLWRTGGSVKVKGNNSIPVMCYDLSQREALMPLLPEKSQGIVLLFPKRNRINLQEGPETIEFRNMRYDVQCRRIPAGHLLSKLYGGGVLLAPSDNPLFAPNRSSAQMILKTGSMNYRELTGIEHYLKDYFRLENAQAYIATAAGLLKKMEVMLSNQNECRAGFSIGIGVVVGILLTALASMEYRQNEYIYTLMKSFGIRPVLLVGVFIAENLFLVGISFAAAIQAFMLSQDIVLREFFRLGRYRLSLPEIMPDIHLLGAALVVSVFVSSIPIVMAVRREIGRVLQ